MIIFTLHINCFLNYFEIGVCNISSNEYKFLKMYNDEKDHELSELKDLISNEDNQFITYNGNKNHILLLALYISGANNYHLKIANDDLINNKILPWRFEKKYSVKIPKINHIDLIEILPGDASVEAYAARNGSQKLQELPIHHDNFIMPVELPALNDCLQNDLTIISELYSAVSEQIKLREKLSDEYGIDLRSKSDAQIAEHVMKHEFKKETGEVLGKNKAQDSYKYIAPYFINFKTEFFKDLVKTCENAVYELDGSGKVKLPSKLGQIIQVSNKQYKLGMGGLHSVDKAASYYSDDVYQIIDVDVASFYPRLILSAGLTPKNMGELFVEIFKKFVDQRLDAKRKMKESEYGSSQWHKYNAIQQSLKILINGTFGKLGSKYSVLYSPDLLFHTTISGQLLLLMLIEQLDINGIEALSANTDGITVKLKRTEKHYFDSVIRDWEFNTGFLMDYTFYDSIHYRDVNNYFAITDNGDVDVKGIGIFNKTGLNKNPSNEIIYDAVKAYAKDGIDTYDYISSSEDVTKFLTLKKSTGGAQKDGELLGETIRWYRSDATDTPILKCKSNDKGTFPKVAGSDCCMPMMDLEDELPCDLDIQFYVDEANKLIKKLGVRECLQKKMLKAA